LTDHVLEHDDLPEAEETQSEENISEASHSSTNH